MNPKGANSSMLGLISATSSVEVRTCATFHCDSIGSAVLGELVEITGAIVNGFYPVSWYGSEGYVFALYVTRPEAAPWLVEGQGSCDRVALVFNIGIGEEPSRTIIDILSDLQTPATMFPMGWWARKFPDYLTQLDDAGFVIGTHGDQPLMLTSLSDDAVVDDLSNSVVAIEEVIGRDIERYATPYAADSDNRVRAIVSSMGLLPVGWRIPADDYGSDATEASVYERVVGNVYPGAIIEMHLDGPATEQSTALALPRIIGDLRNAGCGFVTVPDMVVPCPD